MTATEIITVAISSLALIVSIVAIALQYGHRDNTQYKVTKIELVSHQPEKEINREFAVVLNISVFNMGNKPIALENLSLNLEGKVLASSDEDQVAPSNKRGSILIPPMSTDTYSRLGFRPFVVPSGSILTKEIVFDLMKYEKQHKYILAKGELELSGQFYNSEGKEAKIKIPIADINIKAAKEEEPVYNITFNSNDIELNKVLF